MNCDVAMNGWSVGDTLTLVVAGLVILAWLVLDIIRWWRRRNRIQPARGTALEMLAWNVYGMRRTWGETDAELRARVRRKVEGLQRLGGVYAGIEYEDGGSDGTQETGGRGSRGVDGRRAP